MAQRPVRQHYVPRFLLERFCDDKRRLHIFDKWSGRSWTGTSKKSFCEHRFNEAELAREALNLEPRYAHIESYAAPVVCQLLEGRPPEQLSPFDRGTLCVFIAVQHLRSPAFRAQQLSLTRRTRSIFPNGKIHPNIAQKVGMLTDVESRFSSIAFVSGLASDLLPFISSKFLFTARAYPGCSFMIGDSPVAIHNGVGQSLGVGEPGCEIHLPLSSETLLIALCPSLVAPLALRSKQFRQCVETGRRIDLTPDNMAFEECLQIRSSERFIAKRCDDFSMAMRMITDRAEYKHSTRWTMTRGNTEMPEVLDWNPEVIVVSEAAETMPPGATEAPTDGHR